MYRGKRKRVKTGVEVGKKVSNSAFSDSTFDCFRDSPDRNIMHSK